MGKLKPESESNLLKLLEFFQKKTWKSYQLDAQGFEKSKEIPAWPLELSAIFFKSLHQGQ